MDKNILYEIIMKYERGNDWRGQTTGTRSLSFVKNSLYDKYGQSNLVSEALYWETQGIIQVTWEKMNALQVPEMQLLINHILKERKVIEQESFLMM